MQRHFQSNISLTNLVSNQMYHQIDGILLASCKHGKYHFEYEELLGDWSQSETAKYFE